MKKINTRFGEVEYEENNLLIFPQGLIGLSHLKNFVVMPNEKKSPLFWIQSVDDPAMAFVLTNPQDFFRDYVVNVQTEERSQLDIEEEDEIFILSIVTVPPTQDITLNLAAPILFAPKSNKALQVILETGSYSSKTSLPQVETKK